MFEDFESYTDHEPMGVELPKIYLSKEELSAIDPKLSAESSSLDVLKSLARQGIKERGIDKLTNRKEYYDRAQYELGVFDELGFVDYVLLNWDIIGFCHKNGIPVGMGRGSSCSSIILYLLRVTNIDPIENELFFERFVSKARARKIVDKRGKEFLMGSLLPDVDSDISYDERHKVISYIEERHSGRTSKILTFNTFSSKLCIREAVKYFEEVKEEDANFVSDLIPKSHGLVSSLTKSREESEAFDRWTQIHKRAYANALKVEDLYKNTGLHPSGIAICASNIEDVIPLQKSKEGALVSGYDMSDVSELMVKFDILGLRTLTIAHNACLKLGITLNDINPHDPFIYEVLQNFRHKTGLFQMAETNFRVCQQVKPNCLQELSDVISLARPGALQFTSNYVENKKNPFELNLHPELDKILAGSKNVILYQEQLSLIANKVFGFSLDDSELLRKIVSKKRKDEMPLWKERIYKAGEENGLSNEICDFYWSSLEASADYSFCKCIFEEEFVEMEDGERLMLKDCEVGNSVKAFNPQLQQNEYAEVKNIYHSFKPVYEVQLENGKTIRTSMDHKFFCDNGEMVMLKDIVGSELRILSL